MNVPDSGGAAGDAEQGPRLYVVRLTEPAEADIEAEHERLSFSVSPEYADRWRRGLVAEIRRLALFPASHEIAPENDVYDVVVRRMLYHGPSGRRRRGGVAHRVLFYVVEADEVEADEDEPQGVVRVLHVWHGAKRPLV